MQERILQVVLDAVAALNEELGYEELEKASEDTVLHGGETGLDSLSLVSLIVDVEERVAAAFGRAVALADEKALSRRQSPYRTVGTLVALIRERLEERDA